ncbi:MAG: RodZ domain-containing protein [Vicinamibacterales bacterium]
MENFGLELKHAREGLGVSLREIATRTKISVTQLEALERNDFSRVPGGIFGRAFVRAYAVEVGVDPDETVASFIELLERSEQEAAARGAVRPEITADDRRFLERQHRAVLALRVGLVVLVITAVVVGVWQGRAYLQRRESAATLAAQPVAAAETPLLPSAPAGSAQTPTEARLVVEFDFTGDCWISVSIDGKAPVPQLFHAGDHQRVEADREILLDVNNAGVTRMTINGKPAKPLGRDGVPAKTRLTRENLAEFQQS